jgi:hypothetical protein
LWSDPAACRVYHICKAGLDVEITDPFASGEATEKPVVWGHQVPGATAPARNLFDVSQALSWVATGRNSSEEKVEWQSSVAGLIERLALIV